MKKKIQITGLIFAGLLLFECTSIPKQEMMSAQSSIASARRVKAEKYAKEDIQAAESIYAQAELEIKEGKKKEAKINALAAKDQANKAYFKSVQQFVEEENKSLDTNQKNAEKANSAVASPDKYNKAVAAQKKIREDLKKLEQLKTELAQLENKEKEQNK